MEGRVAFHGDRIVIGSDTKRAAELVEKINAPFGIPVYHIDISSAEMIKYDSNTFLVTKINFISEISKLCENLKANVEDVTTEMGINKPLGASSCVPVSATVVLVSRNIPNS